MTEAILGYGARNAQIWGICEICVCGGQDDSARLTVSKGEVAQPSFTHPQLSLAQGFITVSDILPRRHRCVDICFCRDMVIRAVT